MSRRIAVTLLVFSLLALLLLTATSGALNREGAPDARISAQPGALTLTIYQDQNLALVQDERTLDLVEGLADYTLRGLSEGLLPDSVQLGAKEPTGALQLVEQIYRGRLPTLEQLLEQNLGEEIEVFAPGGLGTYRGRLVGTQGGIVLRDDVGRLQVIQDATRFRLSAAAVSQEGEPTLSVRLLSEISGAHPIRLSYLSEGLNWSARYTAVLSEERARVDLESWVSIDNLTGMDFREATLHLIAGQIHRVSEGDGLFPAPEAARVLQQEVPGFAEQAAFEYHRYTLGRPATLPGGETIRQAFLPPVSYPGEVQYRYEAYRMEGVQVWVSFENDGGKPLPAGLVRVYQRDPEGLLFLGEDRVGHTPVGERVRLFAGRAFDLVAERVQTGREHLGENAFRESYRVSIASHKAEEVVVRVLERLLGDWTVVRSTHDFTKLDVRTIEFLLPVAAGDRAILEYTVEYRL